MLRKVACLFCLVCCAIAIWPCAAATLEDVRAWGGRRDVERLLLAVTDSDAAVAMAAKQALDDLNEPLGGLILSSIRGSSDARADLARRKDFRATAPLAQALSSVDPVQRMYVVQALADLGDQAAAPALIEFIERQDVALRLAADRSPPYWALVKLKDPRALDVFLSGLENPDPLVRAAAAWGVAGVMDARAVRAALVALSDADPRVRAAAAYAFKNMPVTDADAPLIRLLSDPASEVREAAAYALGNSDNTGACAPLRKALGDDAKIVRSAAAWALGNLRDTGSIDALIRLLGDPSPQVREFAAKALDDLDMRVGVQVVAALQGEVAARNALAVSADPRVVGPLSLLANGDDAATRRAAVRVLVSLPDAQAEMAVVDAAAHWNLADRASATWLLLTSSTRPVSTRIWQLFQVAAHPSSLVYLAVIVAVPAALAHAIRRRRRTHSSQMRTR